MEMSRKQKNLQKHKKIRYEHLKFRKRALNLMLLSLAVTLIVEFLNQRTPGRMLAYLTGNTLYFLFNWLIVLTTMTFSELFRRRRAVLWTITAVWLILGTINYILVHNRTQPLIYGDMILTQEMIGLMPVYFTWTQIILIFFGSLALIAGLILLYSRTRMRKRVHYGRALMTFAGMALLTFCLCILGVQNGFFPEHISSRVDAYNNYGFSTCFALTFGARGVQEPEEYSQETVEKIMEEIEEPEETPAPAVLRFSEADDLSRPNIIYLQLESFFDVDTIIGARLSEDPTPVWHELLGSWPNAELYVPTIGGGTANVEFEVMAGMNMDFFGAGETPYNTLIPKITCETVANILKGQGYCATAIHNNTGTFFSRNEVYANMGYDRFVPLEYMSYPEYTDVGWCCDAILTDEILSAMRSSQQRDLVFAISVESHGKYADTYEAKDGDIQVLAAPENMFLEPFQNYVNIIPGVDRFIGELTAALEEYEEPVLLIMYGDHLPGVGLSNETLTTGNLYASRYILWNNFGGNLSVSDMEAYRLSSDILAQLEITDGVMNRFHQAYSEADEDYMEMLQTLEYDLLYGDQEAYGESGSYEPAILQMGIDPVVIESVEAEYGRLLITGKGFTEYSAIICGEDILPTVFVDAEHLVSAVDVETDLSYGSICVAQLNPDGKELGRTKEYTLRPEDMHNAYQR